MTAEHLRGREPIGVDPFVIQEPLRHGNQSGHTAGGAKQSSVVEPG